MLIPRREQKALNNAADDIRKMVDRVIAESLNDPDLITKSPDFRAGYELGLRETSSAFIRFVSLTRCVD